MSLNNPKPQQAEQREVLLASLDVRVRDVQQGPDGNLYIATELQSTGVNPDGTVMRIEPAPQQVAERASNLNAKCKMQNAEAQILGTFRVCILNSAF